MLKRQLSFYATQQDLVEVLGTVASKLPFRIVSIDIQQEVQVYGAAEEVPDLSVAAFGDQNKEHSYLLIRDGSRPIVRTVQQRNGGECSFLDQLSHPESVVLKPGGVLGQFECLLAGQLGTISEEKWSVDLFQIMSREIKKRFEKVRAFYVGREAAEKLRSGVRLTTNVKSPPEYDLQCR